MADNSFLQVAFANHEAHKELCERLQQIRDRNTSDDNIMLEAASIIEDAQAPLLDIITEQAEELEALRNAES